MTGATPSPKDLLARLVAFDTTSAKTNLPLIEFVEAFLRQHGLECRRVAGEDSAKTNLVASIGPTDRGGIGLSAHTDTVPVEGQRWHGDPFTLRTENGRLYGRGTCDMKGFLACMLASVPLFRSRQLKTPIHLLLSYDEEVGCVGVRPMIAELGRTLPMPELVIVGEPTSMRVVDAHKGIHGYETRVRGREAHSSMPHLGVNAIGVAARLIDELERIAAQMRGRADGPRFTPPHTTVHVGRIEGGTARNIVPADCRFIWEFRAVPATEPDEVPGRLETLAARLLPDMRAVAPEAAIETAPISNVPALAALARSPAIDLARALTGDNEIGAVSYGTEAGLFAQAGCPSAVCGPGDIAQAHAPDEFVTEDQLERCMAMLARLLDHASA